MQGGQEPGRGMYLARRIVAALIILLLLIFLVPRACQAFLGPQQEESNTVAPEKSVAEEETTSETAGTSTGGETGEEVSSEQSVRSSTVVVDSEETENQEDLEAPLDLSSTIGEVNQEAVPVQAFGAAQQAVQPLPSGQPILPAEPVAVGSVLSPEPFAPLLPAEQPVAAEPVLPAGPVTAEPVLPAGPILPAEPAIAEPIFLEEPLLSEEPTFFEEEPVFEVTSRETIAAAPEPDSVATPSGGGTVAAAGPVSAKA